MHCADGMSCSRRRQTKDEIEPKLQLQGLRARLDASHALPQAVWRQLTCGDQNGRLSCGNFLNCKRLWRPHLNAKANSSHSSVARRKLDW